MKILLVDDDPGIAEIAALALSRVGGFDVRTTDQADDALVAAAAGDLSCVILDVMMPRVDGPTLFRRLRELPECTDLPIIFLTAKVQTHEVERLMAIGAAGVISKPFDPMTISSQVEEILQRTSLFRTPRNGPPLPLRDVWERRSGEVLDDLRALRREIERSPATATERAHRLTGLCGTFGFAEAGRVAGELENRLLEASPAPQSHTDLVDMVDRIERLLFPSSAGRP